MSRLKSWKKTRRQRRRGLKGAMNNLRPLPERHSEGWHVRRAKQKRRRADRKKRLPT